MRSVWDELDAFFATLGEPPCAERRSARGVVLALHKFLVEKMHDFGESHGRGVLASFAKWGREEAAAEKVLHAINERGEKLAAEAAAGAGISAGTMPTVASVHAASGGDGSARDQPSSSSTKRSWLGACSFKLPSLNNNVKSAAERPGRSRKQREAAEPEAERRG